MLLAWPVIVGKNDDIAIPEVVHPSLVQVAVARPTRIAGRRQIPRFQGVDVLLALGEVNRLCGQHLLETIGNTRANAEAIVRAVIVDVIRCPLPCGLAGSAFRFRIQKVFARVQSYDDAAGGNAAGPFRVGGAGRFNSARTDLNESLLPVRLQETDNLVK